MQLRYLLAAGSLAALYVIAPGCSDDGGGSSSGTNVDVSEFSLADPAVTIAPRVLPGGTLEVSVTARNDGKAAWKTSEVTLLVQDPQGFQVAPLPLGADVAPGASGTFTGKLTAPARTGYFSFHFGARRSGKDFGPLDIPGATEVTCSDGVFCNGMERFVAGACVNGIDPCNDGADCTKDTCDEAAGTCDHQLGPGCASCISDCTPDCTGKVCGDNGCGGSCGNCAMGEGCASAQGTCKAANQPGTCADPIPLFAKGENPIGDHLIKGDTTNALHQATPTCNSTSRAVELVYTFTVESTTGFEARSHGYDTVLYLRKEDPKTPGSECLDDGPKATVACSDDSSPPGDYGSRIIAKLEAGTYYLFVDGFDSSQHGAFDLSVRMTADGCVPHCDGVYCGGSDGCGNDCGKCDAGFACGQDGRCRPDPCTPDCNGKECGPDGCGGQCGSCAQGSLCVDATNKCQVFAGCNHDQPECTPACGAGEYCGVDCACHKANEVMPDLVIDTKRLSDEILFDTVYVTENSCSWIEKCVRGTGMRKVLRFSVEAKNQGQATLTVPPPDQRPDLFIFSPCHGHYHFNGFANYALLDKEGKTLITGQKQAYCMEDTEQIAFGPDVPCDKKYTCSDQGIQKGWSDLYGNALDCQWLDITDTPPGEYRLQVSLNPARVFEEVTLDNNVAEVPVTIP